jgi:hypothetical protein
MGFRRLDFISFLNAGSRRREGQLERFQRSAGHYGRFLRGKEASLWK